MESFGGTISHHRKPSGEDHPMKSIFRHGTREHKGPDKYQFDAVFVHIRSFALEGLPAFYIHSLLGTEMVELKESTGEPASINRRQWNLQDLNAALDDIFFIIEDYSTSSNEGLAFEKASCVSSECDAIHIMTVKLFLRSGVRVSTVIKIFALHNVSSKTQVVSLVELTLGTETWRDLQR